MMEISTDSCFDSNQCLRFFPPFLFEETQNSGFTLTFIPGDIGDEDRDSKSPHQKQKANKAWQRF